MILTITKLSHTSLSLTLRDDSGLLLKEHSGTVSEKRGREWADACGVAYPQFLEYVVEAKTQPASKDVKPQLVFDVPGAGDTQKTSELFTLRVRGLKQPAAEAVIFSGEPAAALHDAIIYATHPAAEPVIEWQSDALAVLDIDYHGMPFEFRPDVAKLESLAMSIQPRPFLFHVSHGRGIKLYYAAKDGFTGSELAAAAALAWCWRDPVATTEVKRGSRHPLYPRYVQRDGVSVAEQCESLPKTFAASVDIAAVSQFFANEADPAGVESWLSERGLAKGQRYPHASCPIAPYAGESKNDPVWIGDDGIHCYGCEGKGRTWGRNAKAGFVAYSQLIGGAGGLLRDMVRHLCHWEHARAVLQHTFGKRIHDTAMKLAYAAVLKAVHGIDNPGVSAAMLAGKDIIRLDGRWSTIDARTTLGKDAAAIYRSLPATWDISNKAGEYKTKPIAERVNYFALPNADLSSRGYPAVSMLHGCRIYGEKLEYNDERIVYPVPHITFAKEANGRRVPRYLSESKRMPIPEAEATVATVFPGLDWNYVRMMLIAKGFAEGRATQCPFILAHGPSRSGKSTTAHVAATIAGDHATEVVWLLDRQRLDQAIRQGADSGSFVVMNEVFKEAERVKIGARSALDPLLNLTEHTTSHVLFAGASPLGRTPVIIVTDVSLPAEVACDVQLGRRFINVPLESEVDWSTTLASIGPPHRFRLHSDATAAACDSILSDVIDRFFSYTQTLEECAEQLGYKTIEKSPEYGGRNAAVLRFLELMRLAPDYIAIDAPKGSGWKRIDVEGKSSLIDAWRNVANGYGPPKFFESRACDERDLAKLFGSPVPVRLDVERREGFACVRFRGGPYETPIWLNGDGIPKIFENLAS